MAAEDLLLKLLKSAMAAYASAPFAIGTAKNIRDQVCDVELEDDLVIPDVGLHSIEDELESKILIKPKEGSTVVIAYTVVSEITAEAVVVLTSEIDTVDIRVKEIQYQIDQDGHLIKGGSNTLKQVIDLIIDATSETVVVQGRNPNYQKLIEAKQKLAQILK